MRKFWGFYDNGRCRAGCNGGTVYIYDQANRELAKFQDIPYAYGGAFQPNTNLFVAKSTAGSLAVYDLDRLALVKKIVITRIGAQDEGFAFTPDGAYFYNIEKPVQSTRTQLTVYRTSDFEVCGVYFADDRELVLEALEYDPESGTCYILGFQRNAQGGFDHGFLGCFADGAISGAKPLERRKYDYLSAYKHWESSGFTEKKFEWST